MNWTQAGQNPENQPFSDLQLAGQIFGRIANPALFLFAAEEYFIVRRLLRTEPLLSGKRRLMDGVKWQSGS
jgi:hypothetical protein